MIAENPLLAGARTRPSSNWGPTGRASCTATGRTSGTVRTTSTTTTATPRATTRPDAASTSPACRATYDQLNAMSDADVAAMVERSPLKVTQARSLPKYFSLREVDFPDLFTDAVMTSPTVDEADAQALIADLGDRTTGDRTRLPPPSSPIRIVATGRPRRTPAMPIAASMSATSPTRRRTIRRILADTYREEAASGRYLERRLCGEHGETHRLRRAGGEVKRP